MSELSEQIGVLASQAMQTCYRARKSLDSNPRVSEPDKTAAYETYVEMERRQRDFLMAAPQLDANEAISLMRELHSGSVGGIDYFRNSRTHFQRNTSIDRDLRGLKLSISVIGNDLDLLEEAANGDAEALKQLYKKVLGERLDQLDAPYLFEIVDFVVGLSAPSELDSVANAKEGLAVLVKTASDLAENLTLTNLDKRFLNALNEYIDALAEPQFSPIKVDLFSNRLRSYLIEMKDELPAFAIAEVSALLLSQERVLRQFPTWREFEAHASKFDPDEKTTEQQNELLESITTETRTIEGIATPDVLDALNRLAETSAEPTVRQTIALGVWRSVENFIKTNIRHMIGVGKALQTNLTRNEDRYARYLRRLIPSLKLYASMDPSRAWLLPVIQWLEETLKAMTK